MMVAFVAIEDQDQAAQRMHLHHLAYNYTQKQLMSNSSFSCSVF